MYVYMQTHMYTIIDCTKSDCSEIRNTAIKYKKVNLHTEVMVQLIDHIYKPLCILYIHSNTCPWCITILNIMSLHLPNTSHTVHTQLLNVSFFKKSLQAPGKVLQNY